MPALTQNTRTDILIIGAGFAGLSAAWRLMQVLPGAKITIVDAGRIGQGPAGRNSGFMIDLPHDLSSHDYSGALEKDRVTIADNRIAIDFAARIADQTHMTREAFARSGKINAAASARGMSANGRFAKHLAALGEPHDLLDAQQMKGLTGSSYYHGGLFTPGAALIQPALYIRTLAGAIASRGAAVFEDTPVTALERHGAWRAHTPGGTIEAPNVLLAVNGHLESFGHMKRRLVHVFTYASMTRALREDEAQALGGEELWALTSADPLGTTVRRITGTGGTRIVVRNQVTYEPKMAPDPARLDHIWRDHDRAFAARFPAFEGADLEHRWGGHLALSLNGVQVIGTLGPGLWSAACQNGLGTVRGTLAGMLVAEAIAGQPTDAAKRAMAQDMPKRLPPEPFASLGARARIALGQARAGAEK